MSRVLRVAVVPGRENWNDCKMLAGSDNALHPCARRWSAGAESHGRHRLAHRKADIHVARVLDCRHVGHRPRAIPLFFREAAAHRLRDRDLKRADGLASRNLRFDRDTFTEWSGDELADDAVARLDAVEPRLVRDDEVVLRICLQLGRVAITSQRADAAGFDAHRDGMPVLAGQREPECFVAVHREQEAAGAEPLARHGAREFLDGAEWESAESGREW